MIRLGKRAHRPDAHVMGAGDEPGDAPLLPGLSRRPRRAGQGPVAGGARGRRPRPRLQRRRRAGRHAEGADPTARAAAGAGRRHGHGAVVLRAEAEVAGRRGGWGLIHTNRLLEVVRIYFFEVKGTTSYVFRLSFSTKTTNIPS